MSKKIVFAELACIGSLEKIGSVRSTMLLDEAVRNYSILTNMGVIGPNVKIEIHP